MESHVPCVVYAAKSTEDVRGSIETQLGDCQAAIAQQGDRRVASEHADEAASAFRANRGPGLAVAKQVNQIELYKQAAGALKINVPKDPMRTSKLMDGVVWDGKDPKKYADGFAIKASVA